MRSSPIVAASLVAALSACGGGGGGGSSPVRPFTSFSAIQPGETVQASGISQTVSATTDLSGNVTSATFNPADTSASSMQLGYGFNHVINRIAITSPQSGAAWSGAQISCGSGVCGAANDSAAGAVMDAYAFGWNYQTFGYWLADTGFTTGVAGAISMGSPTPINGIPISGSATYSGLTGGFYVDGSGVVYDYAALMTATAIFDPARTVTISTSGSAIAPMFTAGGVAADANLDFSGTLSIASGANQFSGPVATSPTYNLTGTAVGRFYGPAAEEIGGVFSLSGGGVQGLNGAFGGKRP